MNSEYIIEQTGAITDKIIEFIKFVIVFVFGYLSPIKEVAHVVLLFFIVDVIYGWRVAVRFRKESFNTGIVWRKTFPRVILTLIALILAFLIDEVSGQKWIDTYKVIGWSVCSLVGLSILKNGKMLTGWNALDIVSGGIKGKFKKETGYDIKDKDL